MKNAIQTFSAGITKTKVVFDLPDEAESAAALNSNMTTVLSRFVDRACMEKRSQNAPREAAPVEIQLGHVTQPNGAT